MSRFAPLSQREVPPALTNISDFPGVANLSLQGCRTALFVLFAILISVASSAQVLTITADNKSVSSGAAMPLLTYTVSPSVQLQTAPTCVSSANSASPVGQYISAIKCVGAAATGYSITYVPGSLTVGNASQTSGTLPDGYVGIAYSQQLRVAAHSLSTTTWTVSAAPAWLTSNASGVVSGTPTVAGSYSFNASWTDGKSCGTLNITVNVQPGFGDLVVSESGASAITKVAPNTFTIARTVNSTFSSGYAVAVNPSNGDIFAARQGSNSIYRLTSSGQILQFNTSMSFSNGAAIAVDQNGNVYVADTSLNGIYKMNQSGQVVNASGSVQTTNPPAPFATLPCAQNNQDVSMVFDRDNNLIVASDGNGLEIDRITPSAARSQLYTAANVRISAIDILRDGSVGYVVALKNSNTLWRITNPGTPSVTTTPFTSNSLINNMTGIAAVAGDLFSGYFVSESNNNPMLKVVPANNSVTNAANIGNASSMTWFRYNRSQISILAPNPLPSATTGTQYSYQFNASGGDCDYTWTADNLPAGLTITAGGLLSGTPSTAGTFSNITVHVRDGHGSVASSGYSITVNGGNQPLSITANNQVATYGGTLPTFTFTLSPNVTLTTQPTCTTTGSTAKAGTYPITCSGASAAGYTISYSPGTLTVNPAVLTVTANDQVTSYNIAIPPLTYSFSGLVNNDTSAVFNGYAPALSTAAMVGSPAGTYTISITKGSLPSINYTFLFVNGTLTINPVQQTPTIAFNANYFVTGDYIARSVSSSAGSSGGFNLGNVAIPDSTTDPEGVPAGAEVLAAFVYWQAVETTKTPSTTNAVFNGYAVSGDQVGSDVTSAQSSCLPTGSGLFMRTYRSSVLSLLPASNGKFLAAGTHTFGLPIGSSPGTPNASLIVIYRLLGGTAPLRATVIYDGNWSLEFAPGYTPTMNLALKGFYDAAANGGAKISDIVGLLQNGSLAPAQSYTYPLTLTDDSSSFAMPNHYNQLTSGQCMMWGATVFSTAVKNSDGDGLADAWKTGPSQGDPHFGNPGYYDVSDGTWIGLPGATHGQRDLFVQLDYMVGTDGHSHQPLPDAVTQVTNAFANRGVHLHVIPGYAITEDSCADDTSVSPPLLCIFPNEPGVVIWKTGMEVIKSWPINPTDCLNGGDCKARFPVGKKDSYHYVLFGHSLGTATWSLQAGSLTSISVASNVATITVAAPTACPTRVTIDGVLSTPALNSVYNVTTCPTPTTFTVATSGVPNGTYSSVAAEPLLAVANGVTDTTSGFSDIGGEDTSVTLGKWGTQATRVNVQAGTLMHEIGHTLSLTHGGRYFPYGNYVSVTEPNCKTNYQSVMNYMFQIDLLGPNGALDFSGQTLASLPESALGNMLPNPLANAAYSTTKWYSPQPPYMVGTNASYHCDGTPVGTNETPLYLIEGAVNPITWSNSQDLNFDGIDTTLDGYNDWTAIDLRQLGAGGADYLDAIGGLKLSGGGGLKLSGGGGLKLSGGGGLKLSGGGGLKLSGGGGLKLSGGGGLKLSGGGGLKEQSFAVSDSYVRPPRNSTTTSSASGNLVSWTAPLFGNIASFTVYRITNNGPLVAIASVPFVSGQMAYNYLDPASNLVASATYSYTVSTVLADGRSSTIANPPTAPAPQTINFPPIADTYSGAPDFAITVTATSGLPVTLAVQSGSSCSLTGAAGTTVHLTGPGTCTITATQGGDAFALPATPVTQSFNIQAWTIQGFYSPVNMSTATTLVWNDIKGGSTVPLKFNVYLGGVQQTSTTAVVGQTVSIYIISCGASGLDTTISSLLNSAGTALRYDGSQFIQNWQSPNGKACYAAKVSTVDGTSITAYFKTQ